MAENTMNMDTMPLRKGHFRVLAVASLGQLTGAGLSTLVGIILPMIQMISHPALSSAQQGAIACTSLAGIMVGSIIFGELSDRRGYLLLFRLCPLIVLAASLAAYFLDGLWTLTAALFLMGLGIGGEYSLDSDYVSEIMPAKWRLTMVGCTKAASSLGNILVAAACFILLRIWDNPHMWDRLLLLISVLALTMFLCRIRFAQSPGWLMAHGHADEAQKAAEYFLGPDVSIPVQANAGLPAKKKKREMLGPKNMDKIILSGIPWACEGVGVYGIGVFLPVLVMALGIEPHSEDAFQRIIGSVRITTLINLFVLAGFAAGIALLGNIRHARMQTWGFVISAAGLAILITAYEAGWPVWASIGGFIIFELFLNAGPHLTTFVMPAQIYPVEERGAGAGIAAAFGKAGAVAGVLFMPMLLEWGGVRAVLWTCVAVLAAGAAVTVIWSRRLSRNS